METNQIINDIGKSELQTLNGDFSGDTTSQAEKDYDQWIEKGEMFKLNLDGSFIHFSRSGGHDYDSGWVITSEGNVVICNDEISLGKETLKMVMENGILSYANWGQYKLKWTRHDPSLVSNEAKVSKPASSTKNHELKVSKPASSTKSTKLNK